MKHPTYNDFIPYPLLNLYLYECPDYKIVLQPTKRGFIVNLYSTEGNLIYSKCTNLDGLFTSLEDYEAAAKIFVRFIKRYEQDKRRGLRQLTHQASDHAGDGE